MQQGCTEYGDHAICDMKVKSFRPQSEEVVKKSCIESFQGWSALEDARPCLCSHKHDLIFKSSPEKDNGEKEA